MTKQFEWRTWDIENDVIMMSYLQLCQHHSLAQGGHLCRGKQKDWQIGWLSGIIWYCVLIQNWIAQSLEQETIFWTVAHTLTARYTHLPQNTFVVAHPEIKFMTINDSRFVPQASFPGLRCLKYFKYEGGRPGRFQHMRWCQVDSG